MSDDVKAAGGRVSATYSPGAWSFTLEAIGQRMKFTGLPPLVSASREQTVTGTGFSVRISTLSVRHWNFFVAATGHAYDKDLSQLSDLPAITLNNMPASVLTTLTGLSRNDASLGATYLFRRFDVGCEAGRSISAIDGVRTRRFGLNAMFYLNRAWSFGLNSMTYIPEASQESSASSNSTVGVVTFKW